LNWCDIPLLCEGNNILDVPTPDQHLAIADRLE
jgi:hypothetical protein